MSPLQLRGPRLNVVLTLHLGSAARGTRAGIAAIVADNVVAAIEGRRPPNICNPEAYRV